MMQLGFVSAILPDFSLEQVFQTAAEIGYDCVEVMCWAHGKATRRYAGITHIDVANLGQGAAHDIGDLAAHYDVSISGLGYYPNALSCDADEAQQAVQQIRDVIAAAAQLGVGRMNTFIGRDWTKNIDENWPRLLDTWKPIMEHAEQHGVKVGIENCPMFFTSDEWPGGKKHRPQSGNLGTTLFRHSQRSLWTQLRSVPPDLATDGLHRADPQLQ